MAAGDLLSGNSDERQVELRSTLFGNGVTSWIAPPGIGGLLAVDFKTQDVPLDHAEGSVSGIDRRGPRTITVPLLFDTSILDDIVAAWITPVSADVELHMQMPVFGHIYVVGRPRGVSEQMLSFEDETASVMGRFFAHPTIHTVED